MGDDDRIDRAAAIQRLAAAAGPFAAARSRLLDATVAPGDRVLELGCGAFPRAADVARRVGDQGRVVGLDITRRLLELARTDSPTTTALVAGDAEAPPFADACLDVVLVDKVLVHLEHPRRALRETARILRPGGRLGALEWDLPGIHLEGADPELQGVLTEVQRLTTASPEAPARLGDWLREAGLVDVRVAEVDLGHRRLEPPWRQFLQADLEAARRLDLADRERTDAWWEMLERRHRAGAFRVRAGGVVATATRRA